MKFYKYQATGNDFVLVNNMNGQLSLRTDQIQMICDRHFGVGSDGLILLEPDEECDFRMMFYNPDASESFCGNGSRTAVRFAMEQGICKNTCSFRAVDGIHYGKVLHTGQISVRMRDVEGIRKYSDTEYFIHTGSPHHLVFTEDPDRTDFLAFCRNIRYGDLYQPKGTNVNLILSKGNAELVMRTYERGVENETLSCGTGVTAAALGLSMLHGTADGVQAVHVHTKGGELDVHFHKQGENFTAIDLIGAAELVFSGEILP